ncbi:hypothetical protein [Listeria immobilis]|uniref:hypothetical protein n=1 Tax=Listeria immobilis TaxID=2713502 RepID=UPI001625EA62|nr:hypothetical protein [Listeria immobilis]MBC1516856.1 hypothetical protein [Listeria immobilis]
MPGMISKQPNGLFCRISTVVEAATHYNMTREGLDDYLSETCQYDYRNQDISEWYFKHGVDFENAISELGAGCSTYEETKKFLVDVGYQNVDEFMKEIAYKWEDEE